MTFLLRRMLEDLRRLPFLVIVQAGDDYRVYTKGMTELPHEVFARHGQIEETEDGSEEQEEDNVIALRRPAQV